MLAAFMDSADHLGAQVSAFRIGHRKELIRRRWRAVVNAQCAGPKEIDDY